MRIETGDVILVRGKTPIISSLIRWFTNSEYTHAGLAVNSHWMLEIDMNKDLAIRPIKRHADFDIYRVKGGLTARQKINIMKEAERRTRNNKGYDWLRIISFILQKLFKTKLTFDQVNYKICSEIVDVLYYAIGIDLLPDKKTGDVSPADLSHSPVLQKVY